MSNEAGMQALLQAYKDGGDFYSPADGSYTFKIVGEHKGNKPLSASMFLEVQGGPDAGQKWLTTFGSLNGNGAGMAMRQWAAVGVTPEWIQSLGVDDYATIVQAVKLALLGVVIECSIVRQGGTGQYADRANISVNSLKLISRPELPAPAQALSGQAVPSAPPAAPTGIPTAPPTASAPATVPAAVPAAPAAPAAAPAGPAADDLAAQIAALQAQQAAQMAAASPNGVVAGVPATPGPAPAIATDEDPGF